MVRNTIFFKEKKIWAKAGIIKSEFQQAGSAVDDLSSLISFSIALKKEVVKSLLYNLNTNR